MSKKRSDTSMSEEPPEINDLKLINGIGPTVERCLHGIGCYTYTQLAALASADIAAAVVGISGLTSERIIKYDWIGQAQKLASESKLRGAQEEVEAPADEKAESALSIVSEVALAAPAIEKTESVPLVVVEPEPMAPAVEITEPISPVVAHPDAKEAHIPSPAGAITGTPRLHQIETVLANAQTPQNFFASDQPFNVNLTLDISDVRVPDNTQINYKVSIYSRSLEGPTRQVVGETSGIITSTDKVTVKIEGISLPKGIYRLKAMLILNRMTTEPVQQPGLVASMESGLLPIF